MCLQEFICFIIFTELRAVCHPPHVQMPPYKYQSGKRMLPHKWQPAWIKQISEQHLFRPDKELAPDLSGLKQLLPRIAKTSRFKTNDDSSHSKCQTKEVKSNIFAAIRDAALFYILKLKGHFKHHK